MTTAHEIFKQVQLYTDETVYTLVRLPASAIIAGVAVMADLAESFSALIADKDEVTLVFALEAWEDYKHRLPDAHQEGNYHLITFDVVLPLVTVGFLAYVTQILAQANIPIMSFSAFSRDHLLVPSAHLEKAKNALELAQQSVSG